MIGKEISHYRILEPLGRGGMGEVHKAEDLRLERRVALKFLPPELGGDPVAKVRFMQEAKAASALDHPNLCTIYDIDETEDGRLFIVMAYYDGETLKKRLEAGPLSIEEALGVAEQVAEGLVKAHGEGIVHRDIKPANLMVTRDKVVKIVDFGLAKLAGEPGLTRTGVSVGTPAYMSPEQARSEEVDHRTDLWSLGVVLYEMVAGRRPFGGTSEGEVIHSILYDDPEPLAALRSGVPLGVQQLVEALLARAPGERCSTAREALAKIRAAREEVGGMLDAPTLSRPAAHEPETTPSGASEVIPAAGEPGEAPRLRRRPLAVVGLTLLATLAVVAWYLAPNQREVGSTDRSIAVLPFETLGQEEATVFTVGIHGDMLTRLSKVADLRVTSRTSVMQFQGSKVPLPEIARELGVTWILRGEVQEVGDQVQVNARLVNARQDRQVWAESYRRELTAENLFEIQGALTREIVDQLAGQLSSAEERAVGRAPTADLDAYRLYVQGRALVEQRTEEELRRAVEYFRQAVDRDPGYALVWAGLADALAMQGFYNYASLENVLPEALMAAQRARDLEPDLEEAYASLGIVQSLRREGATAIGELRRSVELNPSYAEAHAWLGWIEDLLGRPQKALEAAERSVQLNPLAPAFRVYLAEAYLANGNYERALDEAQRARRLKPDYALTHYMEGLVLIHLRRPEEAETALARALSLALPQGTPAHSEIRAAMALTHAADDDYEAARELLTQIDPEVDPFAAGLALAALGELEKALNLFSSVSQWGVVSTPQIRYFFPEVLGPLRRHPEFEEILRQVDRSWGSELREVVPE